MQELKNSISDWLKSMKCTNGMYKMCMHAYSENCLDATTLGYDLEQMIGYILNEEEKERRKKIIDNYQSSNEGFFYEFESEEKFKDSSIDRVLEMHGNYLTFQSIGAYRAIDRLPKLPVLFYDQYIDNIEKYLENNCPWERSPWGSGGMVDNLGTILKCNIDLGFDQYRPVVDRVFRWLEINQDPDTGLWRSQNNQQGINGLVNGGYHLMRGTYFLYKREFKFAKQIIDTIIQDLKENEIFCPNRAHGCNDLDHFFLLEKCHARVPDYRKSEIVELVEKRRDVIMKVLYCEDGGFSFHDHSSVSSHNYIDVSPGVKESDMQGTVFYLQTLISINKILGNRFDFNDSKTHG